MLIYYHYTNGTTTSQNGVQTGYEPDRRESPIHIHIDLSPYQIHIDPYYISVQYKYIRLIYEQYFTVGRWRYPIEAMHTNAERKHLQYMQELINNMINNNTIDDEPIKEWKLLRVLDTHKD